MQKPKKVPLEFHKGCRGCIKNCLWNNPVVTKEKNQSASNNLFGCNSRKQNENSIYYTF